MYMIIWFFSLMWLIMLIDKKFYKYILMNILLSKHSCVHGINSSWSFWVIKFFLLIIKAYHYTFIILDIVQEKKSPVFTHTHMCVCLSHSVVSNSLQLDGLYSPPGSSVCGKNTGVGVIPSSRGIFPSQGLNLGILHWGGFCTIWVTRLCFKFTHTHTHTQHTKYSATETEMMWKHLLNSHGK